MASTQKAAVPVNQRRWQDALAQQPSFAIDIGQHQIEQMRTLLHANPNGLPVAFAEHQRHQIERPGALVSAHIAMHVVGNAVVAQHPLRFLLHGGDPFVAQGCKILDHATPVGLYQFTQAGCTRIE